MKKFSEKEIEESYKKEKMTDIPDLWEKIEGNLAPRERTGKGHRSFAWVSGLAAVLAIVLLTVPMWQLFSGGTKSDSGAPMEMADIAKDESEGSVSLWDENEQMNEGAPSADGEAPSADGEASSADAEEPSGNGEGPSGDTEEFRIRVTLQVAQVQTTMEGFLVTGEILEAEENWFEVGERVTLFYEGDAYEEETFSGTLRVVIDVEEENLKILEILP